MAQVGVRSGTKPLVVSSFVDGSAGMKEVKHISVCICTYKRPGQLARLLSELEKQETKDLFEYSVVVVDNDKDESARETVKSFALDSNTPMEYHVQSEQNIALARNKALENAKGDFIAFIDDDEIPEKDWLCHLLTTCISYRVDGVLGPVVPCFINQPPDWVIKAKFFERPRNSTGFKMHWTRTRTGNVLFRRSILKEIDQAFRPEFGMAGEDIDFFRRMIEKGHEFIWCDEAVACESIPLSRCSLRFLLTRALLRGATFRKHPTGP